MLDATEGYKRYQGREQNNDQDTEAVGEDRKMRREGQLWKYCIHNPGAHIFMVQIHSEGEAGEPIEYA